MTSHPVFLTDKRTGKPVEAELVENISEADLRAVEADWKPITDAKVRALLEKAAGLRIGQKAGTGNGETR